MSEITMMDEGEGDSVGERGGGPRTPHQPPQQPNAQTRKQPLVNVQAITNPEAKKGKPQTRDSLSESALSVKNAIHLTQRVSLRDLRPVAWDLLQQNLENVVLY